MSRIPKILHFCFGFKEGFGGRPWGLSQYVCVRSAVEKIKPDQVFMYYEHEPSGPWWEVTLPLITPVKVVAPREIFGNKVDHPAHRADVVRLERLIDVGGIYLDCDVLVQRDFDDLLDNSVVLGAEGRGARWGTANAIILAEPNAPFIKRWYAEYKSFRGAEGKQYWNEHSVKLPQRLAKDFPEEITILPYTAFFWPLWTESHIHWMFASDKPVPLDETYANHLWERKAWAYIDSLTPGEVRSIDTNFHRWARPYVAELPDDYGLEGPRFGPRGPGKVEFAWQYAKMIIRDIKHRALNVAG